ncbi:hypothetical protein GCM10010390_83260 [Streptomyces mordarskii]|uniref:Uncharacterized protein n=1 Tax=Streptomyces mordarskii TaxID=1226758 RepID=A0ABN1EJF0_9ACTN
MTFAGLRGRDEGERGNDHLRPGADAEHLEGELQRVRSVADREGVLAAMGRGELRLEGADLTAPDVPPLPLIQGPDQALALLVAILRPCGQLGSRAHIIAHDFPAPLMRSGGRSAADALAR